MLWLRDTLKNYMNREDILPKLKERWIQDRKLFYGNEAADLKIEEDQKILERVWILAFRGYICLNNKF